MPAARPRKGMVNIPRRPPLSTIRRVGGLV